MKKCYLLGHLQEFVPFLQREDPVSLVYRKLSALADAEVRERRDLIVKTDLTRVLVESTVRRTLKEMEGSPKRAVRNLVDLGLQFSSGRFQTRLLATDQRMLGNSKSAYYDLVRHVATHVDHEIITGFGVNLGYNSCTKGARLIRETEAQRGFNIPWALHLFINEEKLHAEPEFYPALLQESKSLGIYTYLLFAQGDLEDLFPLLEQEPDCAFVLFVQGEQVTDSFLEKLRHANHVMVSVKAGGKMLQACRRLQAQGRLYAVHDRYTEDNKGRVLSGQWLASVLPAQPVFAFLRRDLSCGPETRQEVYRYVTQVRDGQQYPLVCMEVEEDSLLIDQVISEGECLVGFGGDGSLRTHEGFRKEEKFNIFHHSLEEVLGIASPKTAPRLVRS